MARFLDLSGVRPLSNEGLADFAQNLQKGMQAGAMPEQLRRQAEKERLLNALSQRELDYPGLKSNDPMVQMAELLKYRQAQQGLQNPPNAGLGAQFMGQTPQEPSLYQDFSGQVPIEGADTFDEERPSRSKFVNPYQAFADKLTEGYDQSDPLVQALQAQARKQGADLRRKEQITNLAAHESMTGQGKGETEAIARAMGITAPDALANIAEGIDIYEQGYKKGYTKQEIDNLMPLYAPTGTNITQIVENRGNTAAADVLHNFVRQAIGPNVRTVLGYSVNNIMNQLQGKNIDQQARYLAGIGLATDMAGLQTKMAGSPATMGIIEDMVKNGLNKAKITPSLVSPEVYDRAQQYMMNTLLDMNQAKESAMIGKTQAQFPGSSQSQVNLPPGVDMEAVRFTANKYGITEEEVIAKLQGAA